jgi:hypothetical protein
MNCVPATRQILRSAPLASLLLFCVVSAFAQQPVVTDQIDMQDGRSLRGLILKNTAQSVILQTTQGEISVPKSDIRRIREETDRDVYVTAVTGRGRLPSWRAIIHDFRDHELVWRLQLIPSAAVTEGTFRNIPYMSFNVNQRGVLNIYGNPEDPVAVQFAIRGKRGRELRIQQMVREFLAGHLHSRKEISTLYSLSLRGDNKIADNLGFNITPPGAPGSHGAWSVTVYDPKRLDSARVADKAYAVLTRPFQTVFTKDGSVQPDILQDKENWFAKVVNFLPEKLPKIRGFYRDKEGVFHVMRLEPPS